MKRLIIFLTIITCGIGNNVIAQFTYPVNPNLDILNYRFSINISDTSDAIYGEASIHFDLRDQGYIDLDLVGVENDTGMKVEYVLAGIDTLEFIHSSNRLRINFEENEIPKKVTIYYFGTPANGLLIGDNKFGERVFFGDNYPDRARHWLPTVDHPSDKATVDWVINAPEHYKVIASGKLESIKKVPGKRAITTWKESVPISTKVMVFAAANFSVDVSGVVGNVPVSTWVYKQNQKEGFYDFAIAPEILAYYDSLIAPHPYDKLAHVQSKTMYGGMENASNIFYFEDAVNGKAERESLIAHEIVHQWFGNSATEEDWPHAWLSEGFATYLTHVYKESKYGAEIFREGLKADRERVINYWHKNPLPIVNQNLVTYPMVDNLWELLSDNTYQKGGWVLHMLRNELGDDLFWEVVRSYYEKYKNSTASTNDFCLVAEEVSGKDLKDFFDQWLYNDGHPQLEGEWFYRKGKLYITLNQKQEKPFKFNLDLELQYEKSKMVIQLEIKEKQHSFELKLKKPQSVKIDPNIKLLYEGNSELVINKK